MNTPKPTPLPCPTLSRKTAPAAFWKTALVWGSLGVVLSQGALQAATIVSYTFAGGTSSPTAEDANVSGNAMTTNIGTLGTDSGFSSGSSNAFARANATPATQADALTNGTYFEFTLTPSGGYSVDLSTFSLTVGNSTSSGSFTSSYFIRSSLDSYGSDIAILSTTGATTFSGGVASRTTTSASTTVSDSVVLNVGGAGYQGLTAPVTFRIYTYDNSSSSQSITRFDNVLLGGTVSAVPEPATMGLIGLGGLLMMAARRKRAAGV